MKFYNVLRFRLYIIEDRKQSTKFRHSGTFADAPIYGRMLCGADLRSIK